MTIFSRTTDKGTTFIIILSALFFGIFNTQGQSYQYNSQAEKNRELRNWDNAYKKNSATLQKFSNRSQYNKNNKVYREGRRAIEKTPVRGGGATRGGGYAATNPYITPQNPYANFSPHQALAGQFTDMMSSGDRGIAALGGIGLAAMLFDQFGGSGSGGNRSKGAFNSRSESSRRIDRQRAGYEQSLRQSTSASARASERRARMEEQIQAANALGNQLGGQLSDIESLQYAAKNPSRDGIAQAIRDSNDGWVANADESLDLLEDELGDLFEASGSGGSAAEAPSIPEWVEGDEDYLRYVVPSNQPGVANGFNWQRWAEDHGINTAKLDSGSMDDFLNKGGWEKSGVFRNGRENRRFSGYNSRLSSTGRFWSSSISSDKLRNSIERRQNLPFASSRSLKNSYGFLKASVGFIRSEDKIGYTAKYAGRKFWKSARDHTGYHYGTGNRQNRAIAEIAGAVADGSYRGPGSRRTLPSTEQVGAIERLGNAYTSLWEGIGLEALVAKAIKPY